MKFALAIYLFMLALEGGLAWLAGGSPFLAAASMVIVLIHALLGVRSERVSEIIPLITSALLLGLCPLYYGNNPNVLWLCLLTQPHLLSATRCIREIQSAGTTREVKSSRSKLPIFTLGFYASLGLAFLMLRADLLEMERSTGIMLAAVISLLGLLAWEVGRTGRMKMGKTSNTLSARGIFLRITIMGVGAAMFVLLFTVALPLASDALCHFSSKLKSPRDLPDSGPGQEPSTRSGKSGETESSEGSDSDAGPEMANRTGQPKLPMRAKIDPSDEIRVLLKFESSAQAEALTQQGPFYLRTLAVSQFKDDQWVRESPSGFWVKDATDGKLDGKVEVSKPSPGDVAHEVFIPQSTGHVLPALVGITAYALPELFVRSDSWFQNAATGDIRYRAWSKPLNILSLSQLKIEIGNPGEAYFTRLSTPFGTRLTEIAEFFMTQGTDLSGRLDLLQQFFQTEFKYSLTVENKSGRAPLENFLFDEKQGYCDFFASSAALILRHMGIPSRVAYGYKDGAHDTATDTWQFREFHAHAWTEIFVKDQGWVICDFTPFSSDSSARSGTPPPFDIAKFKDAGDFSTDGENHLWSRTQSLQSFRSLWVPAILGFGLLVAIVSFLLRKRRTPELRAAAKVARERAGRDRQPAYFVEFLRMCQALGHPRLEGQTLMEFHRHLKHSQFCGDDFDDLAAYYYKSRYEDAPQDATRERGFLKRVREFRKTGTGHSPSGKGIHPQQSGEA